jgi:diacylglycerol kinase (ATP)
MEPANSPMNKPPRKGFARVVQAAHYSKKGLQATWKNEESFRLEVFLLLPLFPAAFWLGNSVTEQLLLIGSCILVLIVELINSALESIVDRISTENHPLSGQAKDIGSAAVLLSLLWVLFTWIMVAFNRFASF